MGWRGRGGGWGRWPGWGLYGYGRGTGYYGRGYGYSSPYSCARFPWLPRARAPKRV